MNKNIFPHPFCEVLFIILYIPLLLFLLPPPAPPAPLGDLFRARALSLGSLTIGLWRRSTFAAH